jgi:2-polyprenyl-3-methyl-5-hydroxy-6-metoxy-1,4-benzoquinol methylase
MLEGVLMANRLTVISNSEPSQERQENFSNRQYRRREAQAQFDRLWLVEPERLTPLRNCLERERIQRTVTLIEEYVPLRDKKTTDLGCGDGVLARKLSGAGAEVDAVDISSVALKKVNEAALPSIHPIQDYVPMTTLKDDSYDLVVSTELIAYLPSDEYRLYFSELSRLVKPEGYIVCSTSLDINSENPLERFVLLAETEIQIEKWVLSYHRLTIRLKDFFEAPSHFLRARRDPEYRLREINSRRSLAKEWFTINSSAFIAPLWYPFYLLFKPVVYLLKNHRPTLLLLEKICRFIWSESGISQAIFIGKRRPLFLSLPEDEKPRESKHKKQVWE